MKIGIIGAGHAGVEAAVAARQAGADVTLFSAERVVPYYRPRLIALAFGQADFPAIQMHPKDWYAQQGVDLRLESRIENINYATLDVACGGSVSRFDGIVISSGAIPVLPPFATTPGTSIFPLWNVEHADVIRKKVGRGNRLAIAGGGILGIEAALRARDAGMKVNIVELMPRLMPAQFGERASAMLLRRLNERDISVVLGHGIRTSRANNDHGAILDLDDNRIIEADICLVSIGARPDKSLATSLGIATDKGVVVNSSLQTSAPRIFAAGDVVQFSGITRCSAREAAAQGRIAGVNVAASLIPSPMQTYMPESQPVMFKFGKFELYSGGEPGGPGCEERLLEGSSESVLRSLITRDGIPVGIQMIGTREGFDEYAGQIKRAKLG